MSEVKVIENLLPEDELRIIQRTMSRDGGGDGLPWYMGYVVKPDDLGECDPADNIHLMHMFYNHDQPNSNYINMIDPIVERLKHRSLLRIKANSTMKTSTIIRHGFHVDFTFSDSKTSVFYVNTCDGYTEFEDGNRIESVENRLVTFPSHFRHAGTTCTNQPFRTVINFNYF